ncbi:MAG: T9SS type A sorting domain-containing protein, partial [Muribaculaceae bacterium]|nr:T9SS type A sorting domain-containing protein [Muribaculaceae bacterium]
GWDESLSQDGLLIWHVNYDADAWVNNVVNVNGMSNVDIVRPDKKNRDIVVWPGDEGKYTYLTPETPDFTLTPYKNPNIFKVWISNISYDPETKSASFEYNMYKEIPEMTTLLHDKPTADPDSHNVTLAWDTADGATDYLLTVQYKDLFGRWSTYGDFDGYPVGNNTTFVIKNIPTEYWKSQFTAFVVPYRGYPSKNPSNTINFVPANLDNTAVEVIEADTVGIYGLNGRIEAPAGARVFNINGVETGTENLTAGIYIVVLNGKTAKVVVK